MLNRPSVESVEVSCPSGNEWCTGAVKGEPSVKIPRNINNPPIKSSGQKALSEKVYNHGDTSSTKPINTSKARCIFIGNCLIALILLFAKIAMISCIHPKYIGNNKAALEIFTRLNSHGEAIMVNAIR